MTRNPGPPGTPGPPGPLGELGIAVANSGSTLNPPFRARDVGYFNPDSDKEPVEVKETHQVYHNVFSFTNRLQARAITMDPTILRYNLPSCLIRMAECWYTEELSNITRLGLQNTSINEWCDLLEQRFQDPPDRSLAALEQERYTVTDVRNMRQGARFHSHRAETVPTTSGAYVLS